MKVGDTVTLSKSSMFYDPTGEDEYNPFGVKGVVYLVDRDIDPVFPFYVEWGRHVDMSGAGEVRPPIQNSYRLTDLILVEGVR